jgi:hypothetical protein
MFSITLHAWKMRSIWKERAMPRPRAYRVRISLAG